MVFRRVDTFFQDVGNAIENDPNIKNLKGGFNKITQSIEEKFFASGLEKLSKGDFKQLASTMDNAQKLKEMGGKPHLAFKELLDKNPKLINCKEFENSKIKDTVDSLKKDIIKDSFGKIEGFDFRIGEALDRMSAEDGEKLLGSLQQISSSDQGNCLQVFGALARRASDQFLSEFAQLKSQEMTNLTEDIKTLANFRDKIKLDIGENGLDGIIDDLPQNNLNETKNAIEVLKQFKKENTKQYTALQKYSKEYVGNAENQTPQLLRSLSCQDQETRNILLTKLASSGDSKNYMKIAGNIGNLNKEQLALAAKNAGPSKELQNFNYLVVNLKGLSDDRTKQIAAALNKSEHKKVLLGILKQEKGQDRAVGFVNVLSKDFSSPVQNTLIEILQMPGSEKRAAKISKALSETYKDFNTRDKEVLAEVWAKKGSVAGENLASNLQKIHQRAPQSIANYDLGKKLSELSEGDLNNLTEGLEKLNPSTEDAEKIVENLSKMSLSALESFSESIEALFVGKNFRNPLVQHSTEKNDNLFKGSFSETLAQLTPNNMCHLAAGIAVSLENIILGGGKGISGQSMQTGIDDLFYSGIDKMSSDKKNLLASTIGNRNIDVNVDAVSEIVQLNPKELNNWIQVTAAQNKDTIEGEILTIANKKLDPSSVKLLADNMKTYSDTQKKALFDYFKSPSKTTATDYIETMMQLSPEEIFSDVALTDAQKNDLKTCMDSKNNPEVFQKNAQALLDGIKDPSTENQTKITKELKLNNKQKTLLLNWKLDPSPANAKAFIKKLENKQINKNSHLNAGKSDFDKAETDQDKDAKANAFMKLIATPHPLSKARLSSDQKELAVEYLKRTGNDKAVAAYSLMGTLTKSSAFVESAGSEHANSANFAKFVMQFDPKDAIVLKDVTLGEQGRRLISKHINKQNMRSTLAEKVKAGGASAFKKEVSNLIDTENVKIAREAEGAKRAAEEAAKKETGKTAWQRREEAEIQSLKDYYARTMAHNPKTGVHDIKNGKEILTYGEQLTKEQKMERVARTQEKLAQELHSLNPPVRYKEDKTSSDAEKCFKIMEEKKFASRDMAIAHFQNAKIKVQQTKQQLEELIQSWQQLEAQNQAIVNSLVFPGLNLMGRDLDAANTGSGNMKKAMDAWYDNGKNVDQAAKSIGMTQDQFGAALAGWDQAKNALNNSKNFLGQMFTSLQKLKGKAADKCWDYCSAYAGVMRDIAPNGHIEDLEIDTLPGNIQRAFMNHAEKLPKGTVTVLQQGNGSVVVDIDMKVFQNAIQSLCNEAFATAKQSRDIANLIQETSSKLHK